MNEPLKLPKPVMLAPKGCIGPETRQRLEDEGYIVVEVESRIGDVEIVVPTPRGEMADMVMRAAMEALSDSGSSKNALFVHFLNQRLKESETEN